MPPQVEIKLMNLKTDRRVRIHWFQHDDKGPIHTGSVVATTALGPLKLGGVRGRIACQPNRASLAPPLVNGRIQPCPCSDDVRAVTCDLCAATEGYRSAVEELAGEQEVK